MVPTDQKVFNCKYGTISLSNAACEIIEADKRLAEAIEGKHLNNMRIFGERRQIRAVISFAGDIHRLTVNIVRICFRYRCPSGT